ncbi:hypothetical protein [Rhizobium metallidurans]|uniref:Uncharacterized protein n=1 Tax=Rhizobium metallidurans TaxID=1265931 RepID=A0A7W6CSN6_9HYPH|nr:hypothetical protein [Rhizobium metallidurans]MBB3966435.1 hypothetical protein [Rhizobium metallidurans]
MFINIPSQPAEARVCTMLNRIAVTNPSIDKRTPNTQQAFAAARLAIIEHPYAPPSWRRRAI